jgi:hypothetical protein
LLGTRFAWNRDPFDKEIPMNALFQKAGFRFPGMLLGGMMAGALGFALAADVSPSASPRVPTDPVTGKSDSYTPGLSNPSADTGMSSATGSSQSGSSRTGTSATGSASSSGKYGSASEGSSSLPPNVSPGWKIRVCSEKTKADQINFKFTPAGSKTSKGSSAATGNPGSNGIGGSGAANDAATNAALSDQTASWTRGEASEINLPSGVRDADKLRIEATPSQKDKKASVCVIYDDHVAKKLNFDDREVSTVKSTDNGECGC